MGIEITVGLLLMRVACALVVGLAAGRIGRRGWLWALVTLAGGVIIGLGGLFVAEVMKARAKKSRVPA